MKETRVTFRVGKELVEYHTIPINLHDQLIAVLKTMASIYYWQKAPIEGEIFMWGNITLKLKFSAVGCQKENVAIKICIDSNKMLVLPKEPEKENFKKLIGRIVIDALERNASHVYINVI